MLYRSVSVGAFTHQAGLLLLQEEAFLCPHSDAAHSPVGRRGGRAVAACAGELAASSLPPGQPPVTPETIAALCSSPN